MASRLDVATALVHFLSATKGLVDHMLQVYVALVY